MMESLVMTVIGKDRPGLVESLSAAIEEHGGNWEESRMVHLAGEFAGLVHVHLPGERIAGLEKALDNLAGMSVVVARTPEDDTLAADTRFLQLEVVGQDHPGIVRRLAEAITSHGLNVEELETEIESAAMSGETMFKATARLQAPGNIDLDALQDDLEELAHDLVVELTLDESTP